MKKVLKIDSSVAKDRSDLFNKLCEMQAIDIKDARKSLNITAPSVSIQNIFDLCKSKKLKVTFDFENSTVEVISGVVTVNPITTPELIKSTKADMVKVTETKVEDSEDEEDFDDDFNFLDPVE
jgi:hypothetical protein